jgi:hypothetical protein
MSAGFVFTMEKNFVPILYQMPAFGAFDDFNDFLESISCETSKTCQVCGSNPCRTDRDCLCVDQELYDVFVSLFFAVVPEASKMWRLDVGAESLGRLGARDEPDRLPHHANSSRRSAIEGHAACTVAHRLKPDILGPYLDLMRETERDRHGPYRRLLSMAWAAESQRRTPEISLR